MKGRIYDPLIGQFLTADPAMTNISSPQGINRFAYVENSPLNFVDPSGFTLKEFGEDLLEIGARVGEAWVLAQSGAYMAGQFGNSPWMTKEQKMFHGGLNGAFTGYRGIYSFDLEGIASFHLDSTQGITGTALGNFVNVFNTGLEASGVRGTDDNWKTEYSASRSERQNRQVFTGGFRLKSGYAHTQGNVISNYSPGHWRLLDHETEHVWQNRLFGPAFQSTYAYGLVVGGAIGIGYQIYHSVDLSLTNRRLHFSFDELGKHIERYAYYSNPWEAHAYCANNPGAWGTQHAGNGINLFCDP
jgi:hypothetical protein